MKIYDTKTAPTPRRVRIFLAEKGIDMEYVQVDLAKGENLSPEMRAKNPIGKIPILELDDGTCVSESDAICTYFEALHPQPSLMGTLPLEKAIISQWQRQVEMGLFMQVGMCFQHTSGYFKDRMTPVPEFGKEAGKNAAKFMSLLNKRLAESPFIAGDKFSIADITALCAIDFARVVDIRINPEHEHLLRWHAEVSARPSAKA
ncbi:glutathione S-transferase family protein [Aestuariibacter salexigens]|uniref:glutathione S-transferase family protein n=1 Tax=Aestuariibacter salexigens TaxID=226010 RepID=UPI00041DBE59|nr:glutathione S-transferase family protein [Aestuariibacter salexigens]